MTFLSKIGSKFAEYFTKGHERSIATKKNIAASLIIKGISIIISLLLVPLTINYVNPTQYGIWLTISSIVAWVSFFDIGFGHGLRNRFAESIAAGNREIAQKYISTTYAVLSIIFSAVLILFLLINFFIDWSKILNAPASMAPELSVLALIVFGFFCIQMVLRILRTILMADQKPALSGFVEMSGQLLALGFIFILTKTTEGSLVKLGLALSLAQIIVLLVASFIFFNGKYKEYKPSIKHVEFSKADDILNLGIKFFVIQVSAIIIFQTTNIVITQVLGPSQVTVYNIAYKYFFVIGMVFSIIITPFWSAFTDAFTKVDFGWMRSSLKGLQNFWLVIIPTSVIMLLLSSFVYRIWIGNSVTVPFLISFLMALYVIMFTRFSLFINLINGIGKVHLQLYVNITISVLYIPAAVYSCKYLGLTGIVLANILVALTHSIISQVQIAKLMNGTANGIWNK